jgi:TPR repeat protein
LYDDGDGVPQDYAQAAFWYRKAAEQGQVGAQFLLGYLYHKGQGVPQDDTQAAAWYRKAAEQGHADAQEHLGDLYYKSQGVPQDYAEAYFWYDLAAAGKPTGQAAKIRDEIESHLTPADLSREQERARQWFEAHQAKPQ